ncbi:metalloregulator ArsR/SmtB family transcription factor [Fuchsiella alkaliacetigena]|nr:metalloregulator ArsR/SmtB family transcription factor [Fuchsiella alkaliacetigena]MCK8825116.1 metalloregulator ArsR/SmtB family transcription factor [Fuchsiella alkaliacetigena]
MQKDMMDIDMESLEEKAQLLKALSHPARLCIVKRLLDIGSCNVSQIQKYLNIPQPTVSQHLTKLKSVDVIEGSRDGIEINYSVVSKEVKEIIRIFFN